MKIMFETLQGKLFEIELEPQDTVEDVKKNIETVQGLPADQQMLIHGRIILEDGTTLEENKVSGKGIVFIMLSKAKKASSGGASTVSAAPLTTTPAVSAATQATPPAVASGGPDANPLDLFPQSQGLPNMGSNASAGTLDLVRNSRQFQELRTMVKGNPQILQHMLQELGKQNLNVVRLIQEYQADLIRLIKEPGQLVEEMPQDVTVTPEEREANESISFAFSSIVRFVYRTVFTSSFFEIIITTVRLSIGFLSGANLFFIEQNSILLEAMGFDRALMLKLFFACNNNEELAATYLLGHMHEFED
ncbi:hypothetical protein BUALT_Bualt04G0054700 [Buddleja alternifolia]|uniref:Ubiquitin receptor RAD23 n=1 Tax=Buddleja alternifolia TaxID=168488 RepID=A0AAV6XLJ5_9LAMI|nr:hypothetical protein BUALT_Bualt04G0054700 [Buddleja alternifolia]